MKKRILSWLCALCLCIPCVIMLSACGDAKPDKPVTPATPSIVGTYYADQITLATGVSLTYQNYINDEIPAEIDDNTLMGMSFWFSAEMNLVLNDDNTATFQGAPVTWSQNGNVLTLSNGQVSMNFTINDGTIVYSAEGTTITYKNITEQPKVAFVGVYYIDKMTTTYDTDNDGKIDVTFTMTYQEYLDGRELTDEEAASETIKELFEQAKQVFAGSDEILLELRANHTASGVMFGKDGATWTAQDNVVTVTMETVSLNLSFVNDTFDLPMDDAGYNVATFKNITVRPTK